VAGVPEFADDYERYDWEIYQRYRRMDKMDRWPSADGVFVLGPPLPPNSLVFTHDKATEAFKLATAKGYIAMIPSAKALGVSKPVMRRIFDRMNGIDIAFVVYEGTKAGSRYHCRMVHNRSIAHMKKTLPLWVKESRRGGKKTGPENVRRVR
tara:strand:+ start:1449 stop:1904 length:456 start_codon:yes stop_codon:yes gene_type:complete